MSGDGARDHDDMIKSTVQLTESLAPRNPMQKLKATLRRSLGALANTTVEPCVLLYMVSVSISALAVKAMNLDKACRVNLALGDDVCDRISVGNSSDLKEEIEHMQTMVARVSSWEMPLQTTLPGLLVLFLGAWSDRTRRRTVCILTPIVGEMLTSSGLLLSTRYMREWSLETTALIEALPSGLSGGWITFFMGVYSYMTDITSVEERTFRLGVVAIFGTLGTPAGTALGGVLLKLIGYYGVFSLVLCFHAISLTYGIIFLKDMKVSRTELEGNSEEKIFCIEKFITRPLLDTMMVLFKKRSGRTRMQIFAVLLLYFLMVGPLYGDAQAAFLYSALKFNFTALEFSLYSTFNTVAGLIGTVLCITILIKTFGVEDSAIGVLAGASRIAACFIFAFAPTRGWFYSAPAVNFLSHTGLMAIRSMSSKLVPKHEFAKLSSLLGVCEGLAPSIYTPITNTIYIATLKTLPGAFYLFDAALTVMAVILFLLCYILHKNNLNSTSDTTQADVDS